MLYSCLQPYGNSDGRQTVKLTQSSVRCCTWYLQWWAVRCRPARSVAGRRWTTTLVWWSAATPALTCGVWRASTDAGPVPLRPSTVRPQPPPPTPTPVTQRRHAKLLINCTTYVCVSKRRASCLPSDTRAPLGTVCCVGRLKFWSHSLVVGRFVY